MNMPGFTAEASVYKTRDRYQLAVALSADTEKQVVVPQRESAEEQCMASCLWSGGSYKECFEFCYQLQASYEGP